MKRILVIDYRNNKIYDLEKEFSDALEVFFSDYEEEIEYNYEEEFLEDNPNKDYWEYLVNCFMEFTDPYYNNDLQRVEREVTVL